MDVLLEVKLHHINVNVAKQIDVHLFYGCTTVLYMIQTQAEEMSNRWQISTQVIYLTEMCKITFFSCNVANAQTDVFYLHCGQTHTVIKKM